MPGIAHVSFAHGGTFLPARTPYDRQILTEYVAAFTRTKGEVQVLIDRQRWLISGTFDAPVSCERCGFSTPQACTRPPHTSVLCLTCALNPPPAASRK